VDKVHQDKSANLFHCVERTWGQRKSLLQSKNNRPHYSISQATQPRQELAECIHQNLPGCDKGFRVYVINLYELRGRAVKGIPR